MFESVNFKEYIRLLAPFSVRAPREAKVGAMFAAYDIDQDGVAVARVGGLLPATGPWGVNERGVRHVE